MTIASLAIIGVIVSLLVQYLKNKFGGGAKTIAILIALSLVAGVASTLLKDNVKLMQTTVEILATANLIYNFFLQWLEK